MLWGGGNRSFKNRLMSLSIMQFRLETTWRRREAYIYALRIMYGAESLYITFYIYIYIYILVIINRCNLVSREITPTNVAC
jgi:hypothetical protein